MLSDDEKFVLLALARCLKREKEAIFLLLEEVETSYRIICLTILLVLWKSDKELTVYKICQRTGLGRSSVARHLRNLVSSGLISRTVFGEIPLYAINKGDFKAKAMIEFFARIKL